MRSLWPSPVHNAIAALYSIARGQRGNYLALAAGRATVETACVEAFGLLADGAPEVRLVVYESPLPPIYAGFADEPDPFFAWCWRLGPGKNHRSIRIADLLPDGTRCTNTTAIDGAGACFASDGSEVQITYVGFNDNVPENIREIIRNGAYVQPGISYGTHGTHVGGTMVANRDGNGMHGVAFGADLTAAKLFFNSASEWQRTATGYSVVSLAGVGPAPASGPAAGWPARHRTGPAVAATATASGAPAAAPGRDHRRLPPPAQARLRLVLWRGIGRAEVVADVDEADVLRVLAAG